MLVGGLALIVGVSMASAAKTQKDCGALDGLYDIEESGGGAWVDGAAAPGITIDSASDQKVVFTIAQGYTAEAICARTGSELNNYSIDKTLPLDGPQTVTVTKNQAGLAHIAFDTMVTPQEVACEPQAPNVSFQDKLFIDKTRAGGEPVSVVAQDGSISVSAHAGTTHIYKDQSAVGGVGDFAVGYTNQTLNWRSTDGGRTWQYVGIPLMREGPHSATSTGFSDPDFAMDQAGNIYNTEIDLANDSVFKSMDDGQSYPIANPMASAGDRPWLTALEEDEVFLYVNLPKHLRKSTDPALGVWELLPTPPVTSKSLPDPKNPADGLIGPVGLGEFAISGNDAQTWTRYRFGPPGPGGGRNILGRSTQFFGAIGVDRAGNVYQAAAGGYGGASDTTPNGEVTFTYYERATGDTNQQRINIPIPPGDALWPWIVAGDDGRVAVVWYQNAAGRPREFDIYAAVTHNAHGDVKCADGTTKTFEPKWTVVKASDTPIHVGNICLRGTNCNDTLGDGGDRRLGDFFTVNFDMNGDLFIVSADTTLTSPLGGKKPVGNPVFIKQAKGGDKMLEQPISPRRSRCLWPIPSC